MSRKMNKIHVAKIVDENRFKCMCPFHKDLNPSLSVDLNKGAYCFAGCYSGDVIGLVAKFLNVNRLIARAKLLDAFDFSASPEYSTSFKKPNIEFETSKDWFLKSGFTLSTALYWKIDFSTNSLTMPIRNAMSETVGLVTRNLVFAPKYIYSEGFKKNVLFGENFLTMAEDEEVIVAEGIFDVIWLWQNGFSSAGLFGTTLTNDQYSILSNIKIKCAFFDDDQGGHLGGEKLRKRFNIPIHYYDVRKLDKNKIKELVECQ